MTETPSTLPPLKDRLNPHQQQKRQGRMNARVEVAMELRRQQAITRGLANYALQILGLPTFWQRLRWLCCGIVPKAKTFEMPVS